MGIEPGFIQILSIGPLSTPQIEIVAGWLNFFEVEAFEEERDIIRVYHPDEKFISDIQVQLKAKASWLEDELLKNGRIINDNWNKRWESSFKPVRVDDFCLIKTSFHPIESPTRHVLVIDPEMAFGTGHHNTTFLMIQMMSEMDFLGKTVLDFGTGTGVLAILAEQLGASGVLAIDYDVKAIDCAIKNLENNKSTLVECQTAEINDLSEDRKFDIILANVNRNVLLHSCQEVSIRQEVQGSLVLSGLLLDDQDVIVKTYEEEGYSLEKATAKGEWCCLQFRFIR